MDYTNEALIETDVTLISVDDLYIQYDVPKGYNVDSLSRANVLVTQANDTMSRSVAVANLSIGQSFIYYKISDLDNSTGIVIEVCNAGITNDTLDFAIISIFLDDGVQKSSCYSTENGTLSPTSPTSSLSAIPSSFYSSVPSIVPTIVPSMSNRISIPSPRPIPLPENTTTNSPSFLQKTVTPSDGPSVTRPAGNSSSLTSDDSGRTVRSIRLTGTTEFLAIYFATPIALQYVVNWMIVHMS